MLFNFRTSSSSSLYIVFFFLLSKSEHLHLLNHLVKFMSSGNLLWVSHYILLKIKTYKQSVTIKRAILKSTHTTRSSPMTRIPHLERPKVKFGKNIWRPPWGLGKSFQDHSFAWHSPKVKQQLTHLTPQWTFNPKSTQSSH